MMFSTTAYLVALLLLVIQVLAALPWPALVFFQPLQKLSSRLMQAGTMQRLISCVLIPLAVMLLVPLLLFTGAGVSLERIGYFYGAVLQFQLLIDAFIVVLALLLRLWP